MKGILYLILLSKIAQINVFIHLIIDVLMIINLEKSQIMMELFQQLNMDIGISNLNTMKKIKNAR